VRPFSLAGALAVACVLIALPAAAQPPETSTPPTPSTLTPTDPMQDPTWSGTVPGIQLPGVLLPPRVGPDLFYAPPVQGPLTVTPSLTVGEEFNDNIFLSNANKHSDFITQFTPGLLLQMQQPGFRLTAAYNFTAEIYAQHSELNGAANRQNLVTSVSYETKPGVTLSLTETLFYSNYSNAASLSGTSSGRQAVWSNVFAPALSVQATQRLTWRLSGAYTLERYNGPNSRDSNIYRIGPGLDYAVTPRLTLTAGYDFGYLDIDREPTALNHTLRLGGTYRITRTLTATLTGGPSVLVTDRDTTVSPAVSARLTQEMSWGAMSVFYDRAIGTSGGFGGPSDNQTFGGNIAVRTLLRGLSIDFSPRYFMSSTQSAAQSQSDIKALTLNLSARYQIARYIAIVGSYTFLQQHGSGNASLANGTTAATDVDQNRINLGLQFGYPINFD
jgi:hypothetical protein